MGGVRLILPHISRATEIVINTVLIISFIWVFALWLAVQVTPYPVPPLSAKGNWYVPIFSFALLLSIIRVVVSFVAYKDASHARR